MRRYKVVFFLYQRVAQRKIAVEVLRCFLVLSRNASKQHKNAPISAFLCIIGAFFVNK